MPGDDQQDRQTAKRFNRDQMGLFPTTNCRSVSRLRPARQTSFDHRLLWKPSSVLRVIYQTNASFSGGDRRFDTSFLLNRSVFILPIRRQPLLFCQEFGLPWRLRSGKVPLGPPKQAAPLQDIRVLFRLLELSIVKKILMLVGVAVGGLVYACAIHFQQNGNEINISIDEQKVKEATEKVIAEEQAIMKNAAAAHPTQAR